MFDLFIQNWDIAVKIVTGIIAMVPAFIFTRKQYIKRVKVPIQNLVNNIKKIDKIEYAVGPNGGRSLYDKIVNIDNRLAKAEVRSKSLITALDIAEWQSDINGNCIYVNAAACQLLNRTQDDFMGRNWVNVVFPADRERIIEEWDTAIKEKRTFIAEYRWMHSDGTEVPIKVVAHPVFDSSNNLIGWLAVIQPKN